MGIVQLYSQKNIKNTYFNSIKFKFYNRYKGIFYSLQKKKNLYSTSFLSADNMNTSAPYI